MENTRKSKGEASSITNQKEFVAALPQVDFRRVTLKVNKDNTLTVSAAGEVYTGPYEDAKEWLLDLAAARMELLVAIYRPDRELVRLAQKNLDKKKISAKVLSLDKRGFNLMNSKFIFELESGYTKECSLNTFLKNPSVERATWSGVRVERTPYTVKEMQPKRLPQGTQEYQFHQTHRETDFELIERTANGFLVRFNANGGFLKRLKSFNQVLNLDPNFQAAGSRGQYYVAQAIMEKGYEVELEYTIPGTMKRIDIAVWNKDLNRLLGFVEIDGVQHQKSVDYFDQGNKNAIKERKSSDEAKNAFAQAIGRPLIRIKDDNGPFSADAFKEAGLKALEMILA